NGAFNSRKHNHISTILKNRTDSVGLLNTVTHYEQLISFQHSFFKVFGHQIKVLVKNWLRRKKELYTILRFKVILFTRLNRCKRMDKFNKLITGKMRSVQVFNNLIIGIYFY